MQKPFAMAKRQIRLVAVTIAAMGMILGNLASVSAAALTGVSLELSDPRTTMTAVDYTFDVNAGFAAGATECVQFVFNTLASGLGVVPAGMDTTGASLTSSSAIPTEASWTEDYSVNGTLELSYATGEVLVDPGDFVFADLENGNTEATTYYVLIDTFTDDTCATPLDSAVIAFTFTNGEPVSLTIDPTLTFTIAGVAAGQDVFPLGGPGAVDTTVLSNGSGINHASAVSTSTNGISAHDLNVATNATDGYNVYIRHTGLLTNQTLDTIANWTGTNAVPTSFPAPGTAAWGYSTDDADLAQFYGLNLWAGFPTAGGAGGGVVMTRGGATSGNETTRVGQQVGIHSSTPAGTYTTTIVYTVIATF